MKATVDGANVRLILFAKRGRNHPSLIDDFGRLADQQSVYYYAKK